MGKNNKKITNKTNKTKTNKTSKTSKTKTIKTNKTKIDLVYQWLKKLNKDNVYNGFVFGRDDLKLALRQLKIRINLDELIGALKKIKDIYFDEDLIVKTETKNINEKYFFNFGDLNEELEIENLILYIQRLEHHNIKNKFNQKINDLTLYVLNEMQKIILKNAASEFSPDEFSETISQAFLVCKKCISRYQTNKGHFKKFYLNYLRLENTKNELNEFNISKEQSTKYMRIKNIRDELRAQQLSNNWDLITEIYNADFNENIKSNKLKKFYLEFKMKENDAVAGQKQPSPEELVHEEMLKEAYKEKARPFLSITQFYCFSTKIDDSDISRLLDLDNKYVKEEIFKNQNSLRKQIKKIFKENEL